MKSMSVIVLICVVVVAVGCGRKQEERVAERNEKEVVNRREPGPVFAGEVTRFEQMGHYQDGKTDGYAYYVRDPNMKDIEEFCARQQQELGRMGRSLKIYFFDRKDKIPDISKQFVFDRASDDYCVADYSFNGQIGLSEITQHKVMKE